MKRFAIALIALTLFAQASWAADTVVRIGYLRNDLHHLAAWTAIEKGFFRMEGLNVEVAGIFNAGPEEMSAFASKSIDMGYLGMAPSVTGVANKAAGIKAVALANSEGSSIIVGKDSPIRDVQGLKGKSVAIPGYSTVQDFLLRKALATVGLDAGKVNIIVVKPPEMIIALGSGQIDAFIAWEPHATKAVTKGIGRVLVQSSEIWPGHPCCVVAVENGFYKDNPAAVKAFAAAHVKAIAYIKNHPDEAVKIGVKYTGMDEDTVQRAMRNITYEHIIKEGDVKEYLQYLIRFGYVKPLDQDAFVRQYVDTPTEGGRNK